MTKIANLGPKNGHIGPKRLKMTPKLHENKKSENQKSFKLKVFSLYEYALKKLKPAPNLKIDN